MKMAIGTATRRIGGKAYNRARTNEYDRKRFEESFGYEQETGARSLEYKTDEYILSLRRKAPHVYDIDASGTVASVERYLRGIIVRKRVSGMVGKLMSATSDGEKKYHGKKIRRLARESGLRGYHRYNRRTSHFYYINDRIRFH